MKKRITACMLPLVLAVLLACLPALASASVNVTLANSVSYSTGRTTITWTTEGDEPASYIVIGRATDNGSAEQEYFLIGNTSAHMAQALDMLPGKTYEVIVADPDYNILDIHTYTMPDPVTFEDGKLKDTSVKISMDPVKLHNGGSRNKDTKGINSLSAGDIISGLADGSYSYGLKYTMRMPQLAKPRTFFVTVAFESPDGFLRTVVAEELTYDRVNNGYQTMWFYMIGDDFFSALYKTTGAIPQGEYRIHLLWDGMWVNTSTFWVN